MFYDLLAMDLTGFNVRAVPHTAAKAQQQVHSLQGSEAWLHNVLQEGSVGCEQWKDAGLTVSKDAAYYSYEEFCKQQRTWRPDIKDVWSKKIRKVLGLCVADTRPKGGRSFQFAPLADCRRQFEAYAGTPNIEWQQEMEPQRAPAQTDEPIVRPNGGPAPAHGLGKTMHEFHAVATQGEQAVLERAINEHAHNMSMFEKTK
jgi:hypothetical protein